MSPSTLARPRHNDPQSAYYSPGALLRPNNRNLWHYHIARTDALRRNLARNSGPVLSLRLRRYTFEHHKTGAMFGTYEGRTATEAAVRCLLDSAHADPSNLYTTVQGKPVTSFDEDELRRAAKRLGFDRTDGPQFEKGDLVRLPSGAIDRVYKVFPAREDAGRGLNRNTAEPTYMLDGLNRGAMAGTIVEHRLESADEAFSWPAWRTDKTKHLREKLSEIVGQETVTVTGMDVAKTLADLLPCDASITHDGPAHHGLTGVHRWTVTKC